jgi:hypothetical protein
LFVLDVVKQRGRCAARVAGQEHRSARHARQRRGLEVGQEQIDGPRSLLEPLAQHLAPALPGAEHREHRDRRPPREPTAVRELEQVRAEERESIGRKTAPSTNAARRHPQRHDATTHRSTVVIAMSIVTDMPYAAASWLDDPKPTTSGARTPPRAASSRAAT